MSSDAYEVFYEALDRARYYVESLVKTELGEIAVVPYISVVPGYIYVNNRRLCGAYYPTTRRIEISVRCVRDFIRKHGREEAVCAVIGLIFHEVWHFINDMKYSYDDEKDEEIAREHYVKWYRLCLEGLI